MSENLELQEQADLVFLALDIWRESRGETDDVKTGVGYSIINRVNHPGWWGRDIPSVVFAKWQYSSMTNPKDPQLVVWPLSGDTSWQKCMAIAQGVLTSTLLNPIGDADSYFDQSIPPPAWATPNKFVVKLGRINFYKERT